MLVKCICCEIPITALLYLILIRRCHGKSIMFCGENSLIQQVGLHLELDILITPTLSFNNISIVNLHQVYPSCPK